MSSKFAKNTRENYSGADQSVGPATILRRCGPRIIPFEKLADPSKQTGVILGNLKKITRSTSEKSEKVISLQTLKSIKIKRISKEGYGVIFLRSLIAAKGKFSGKCKRGV